MIEQSKKEFELFKKNLENDINNIDDRLTEIKKNMVLLQSNIDRLTNFIINTSLNNSFKLYFIQNNMLQTLSNYDSNYERLLMLKYKYRNEQSDLTLKILRFYEVELKKINSQLDNEDINYRQVMESIKNLSNNFVYDKDEEI